MWSSQAHTTIVLLPIASGLMQHQSWTTAKTSNRETFQETRTDLAFREFYRIKKEGEGEEMQERVGDVLLYP